MENDDIIKPQKGSLNGYVDLHNHSTASDGSRTPSELVDMAAELGLSGMALTDHDTVNGCYELREAAKKYPNLKVISGCEFGVDHPGTKKMEIIALGITDLNPYVARLEKISQARIESCKLRLQKLNDAGYKITWEDVALDENGEQRNIISKPLIVNFLVKTGQIPNADFGYKNLMGRKGPAYVETPYPSAEDTIQFIRKTGAVAILAHPCLIESASKDGNVNLFEVVKQLKEFGLQGMEVQHSNFSQEQIQLCDKIANQLGLLKSGGSDFHGEIAHPGVWMGIGKGQVHVPEDWLTKILTEQKNQQLALQKARESFIKQAE